MALMYDIAYGAAGLVTLPYWGTRLLRTGKWRTDWPARFGHSAPVTRIGLQRTLLIHGVSVGEVSAIRQLVAVLQQTQPTWKLVVSATTDTGVRRAAELYGPRVSVVRFPLDFTKPVRRFLDAVKPDMVALVELEVWPNMMHECACRGIPVCVINGRLSARSFRGYRFFKAVLKPTFLRLSAVAAQTADYAARFRALGVLYNRVQVLDSMKWDTAGIIEADQISGVAALAQAMGIDRSRPLIVAGSTASGEERLLIDACPADAQILLAPRKPERFNEVAGLVPGIIRRTMHPDGTTRAVDSACIFLLDTIGELRRAYALADVVLIGRSFVPRHGGSDPLESISLGKPTAIGPHYANFSNMVDSLRAGDGIAVTDDPAALIRQWLADPVAARAMAARGREVIRSRQGATQRHADLIASLMPDSTQ